MAFRLDIDGVQSQDLVRRGPGFSVPSFEIARNQRPRLSFDLETETPPDKRTPVVLYDKAATAKMLGGLVERRTPINVKAGAPKCFRIECVGFSRYYDFCYWTKQYTTDQTLEDVLDDLVADKLGAYGIAVDAAQVTGPTLTAPFGWVNRKVSDVIKDLVELTGYLETTSAELKLKMFMPGTDTYGTTIDNLNTSAVAWSDSTQVPATKVICIFGPSGTQEVTQTWTANGSDTSWVTDIPSALGAAAPGYVTVDGVFCTVGAGAQFEWDGATSTLSVGTAGTPTVGQAIVLIYTGQFPFTITKDSLASTAIESVLLFPAITNYPQADQTADEQLSQTDQDPRVFAIDTQLDDIAVGQSLPINVIEASAPSTSGLVTAVRGTLNTAEWWDYSVTAEETSASLQKDSLSRLKQAIGQSSSGSSVLSGVSGGSATVLSSPFPLGGSRTASQPVGTTRTPVIDWFPFVAPADITVRIRASVKNRVGGVAVTPHLEVYNSGTMAWDSHQAGASADSLTDVEQTFLALLDSGEKYRLACVTGTGGASAYCIGQVESV